MGEFKINEALSSSGSRAFHLEINSFDEFIRFVTIIRGEDSSLDALKKLNAEVNKGDDVLVKAMETQISKE